MSRTVIPASAAASISANASSIVSPWPKSSGAEPIPPKFPQPRLMRETSSSVRPSRLTSTGGGYFSRAVPTASRLARLCPLAKTST